MATHKQLVAKTRGNERMYTGRRLRQKKNKKNEAGGGDRKKSMSDSRQCKRYEKGDDKGQEKNVEGF